MQRSPKIKNEIKSEKLKKAMIEAAMASGSILSKFFNKKITVNEKDGAGLVTNADLAAEAAALKILKKHFPDFEVLAEESAPVALKDRKHSGRWIIDPLDGTTNFVHRFPMFCVSIAAEWEGELIAGVIYHPILKDLYVGIKGKGATLNKKIIKVSQTSELRDSLLTTGFTYRKGEFLRQEIEAFERLSGIARAIRRPGSAALDLAYTARGVFDGFWERSLSPWDIAAGALIVLEAGGKVTDFTGERLDIYTQELVASNGRLHTPLIRTLQGT